MSAIRALRQLTASSSRVLSTRAASLSRGAVLPAFRYNTFVAPSTRAFSVSARRFGEGACKCHSFFFYFEKFVLVHF